MSGIEGIWLSEHRDYGGPCGICITLEGKGRYKEIQVNLLKENSLINLQLGRLLAYFKGS
jgi:hypothetical protein